ncbi:hypothetical protein ACQW5G_03480 [Fructilactobacillus sp. Tb1]|uniref:hypothetical protein n=1 Tax=Fructilactobacillus sp. Tb1 TaxID=3422304 RepID=UPI003D299107
MSEQTKEEKAVSEIAEIINKLDEAVAKDNTDTTEGHKVRAWFEEHRALHEIKRTLHEVGKIDKYDEEGYNHFVKDYEKVLKDLDD